MRLQVLGASYYLKGKTTVTSVNYRDILEKATPADRAALDVKEQGIPLEMFRVTGSDGRKIGAYRFGDPKKARFSKLTSRTAFAKQLKARLIDLHGCRCAIYLEDFEERLLQIDHRIPFEVAGDDETKMEDPNSYMLLCGSANRAKSWSCEHYVNWQEMKKPEMLLGL